jgi:hypothetical protein
MDVETILTYIRNAVYKRDQARQQKETYSKYAYDSDYQAQYHIKQAEDYRSQAKQYEDEEVTAQRDVEYYQQQAAQNGFDVNR